MYTIELLLSRLFLPVKVHSAAHSLLTLLPEVSATLKLKFMVALKGHFNSSASGGARIC